MNIIYDKFLVGVANQTINITTDTFKIILLNSAYTPQTTDESYTTLVTGGYEISGTGYTVGGNDMSFTYAGAIDNKACYTSPRVKWSGASFTARYAVVYKVSGGSSGYGTLVSCYDLGEDQTVEEDDFELSWSGTYSLTISLNNSGESSGTVTVDEVLSTISKNPLTNKKTTETFGSLGVAMGDEEVPEVIEDRVDRIKNIDDSTIEDMFK